MLPDPYLHLLIHWNGCGDVKNRVGFIEKTFRKSAFTASGSTGD
jgi:hypothetical protein